jgi:isoquinoline 1-oxidoreductase beta subunit
MSHHDLQLSRRALLQGAGALIIGVCLPARGALGQARGAAAMPFAPNAFVRVAADDTVTVLIKQIEFGQGPFTGLSTLVAEEMDADWSRVRAEHAPANAKLYNNLLFGPIQATGGSTAIANSFDQMRKAGAMARAMLVQAAANTWRVPAAEITVDNGVIRHAKTSREGRFGEFAAAAATLPAPDADKLPLKKASDFKLIGKDDGSVKRLDSAAKSNGTALFTMDIQEPGMLVVVVAHPPRFGARVASVEDSRARAVPGVVDIRQVPTGVAVYANATWPAIRARELLHITWDESAAEKRSSVEIIEHYRTLARTPGVVAATHGDAEAVLARRDGVIEAEFVVPYLAHSPMEPLDGYLRWDAQGARARYGCQLQTFDQQAIAKVLGLPVERVEIETLLAGGSFGRRGEAVSNFATELAEVAKALGPGRPVKLVWTREDDVRGGLYRPIFVHRLRGAVRDGKIAAWSNTVVGQSFIVGTPFESFGYANGVDAIMVEGAREPPYEIENFHCDLHIAKVGVPVLSWRSVGHTHTGFAVESFVDELLQAAGKDPVAGRLAALGKAPREAGVLRAVAELARWNGPGPVGNRARGVAVVKAFNTYVAQIAEVSVGEDGEPRVHKVWCAVDCGVAVNPDVIRAQMEGGIGFGLGHALYGEITLDQGRVIQSNFDTYRSLRIQEMPEIEVTVVRSTEKPTGVGEPGVPPIAPAVANALARLPGQRRVRRLPLVRSDVA